MNVNISIAMPYEQINNMPQDSPMNDGRGSFLHQLQKLGRGDENILTPTSAMRAAGAKNMTRRMTMGGAPMADIINSNGAVCFVSITPTKAKGAAMPALTAVPESANN